MKVYLFLFFFALASAQVCDNKGRRRDCGFFGVDQFQCEHKGCCWDPVNPNPNNLPWCFFTTDAAPFSPREVETMRTMFLTNLDIMGTGMVVAAPDLDTGPGGSYYYHWMRDAALSMRAFMTIERNTSLIQNKMHSYTQSVLRLQSRSPVNQGIDPRIEPKFMIPDGNIFTGAWCRPQTDGPGLRAGTLSLYALALLNTSDSYVREYLWTGSSSKYNGGAIKYDLDWVADNWGANSCDLWEEVRSTDFFWGRYNFRYGLTVGAQVAQAMGDSSSANRYLSAASDITKTLDGHYDSSQNYYFEEVNRRKDSAVINAFNDGYLDDGYLAPTDSRVAGTINVLNGVFSQYSINKKDDGQGYGGILYGRYQGDTYDGGNPWVLSTAALAQLYYTGAQETLMKKKLPSPEAMKIFRELFHLEKEKMTIEEFATASLDAGDDVLFRLRAHEEQYGFHLYEQLDKNDGTGRSAHDLTWSYATVLKAMHYREEAKNLMRKF